MLYLLVHTGVLYVVHLQFLLLLLLQLVYFLAIVFFFLYFFYFIFGFVSFWILYVNVCVCVLWNVLCICSFWLCWVVLYFNAFVTANLLLRWVENTRGKPPHYIQSNNNNNEKKSTFHPNEARVLRESKFLCRKILLNEKLKVCEFNHVNFMMVLLSMIIATICLVVVVSRITLIRL